MSAQPVNPNLPPDHVTVFIDGVELAAPKGSMIIHAADKAGIPIPRFCYHDKLEIAANCRMCLVDTEVGGRGAPKPSPACATPVMDGLKVFTRNEKALKAQRNVMEFLLINHPLDCPICDQGGECELQDLSLGYGRSVSRFAERKRVVADEDLGPLVATEMTRCIQCTRCVRFTAEIAGTYELGGMQRGENLQIGTYDGKPLTTELSGNVIDVCPVGALTNKVFRFRARPWELIARESLGGHDALGSNLFHHLRRGDVMRTVPRDNEAVNECWISDRDRYSHQGLTADDRAVHPLVKDGGQWREASWDEALDRAMTILRDNAADELGVLVHPSTSNEEGALLARLAEALGTGNLDHRIAQRDLSDGAIAEAFAMPVAELEQADVVLLVGSNLRHEVPLLHHRVRQAWKRGAKVYVVNPVDFEFTFDIEDKAIVAPSKIAETLQVAELGDALRGAKHAAIIVGAQAEASAHAADIRKAAAALAADTGASLCRIPHGANALGLSRHGVLPTSRDANAMLAERRGAYVIYGIEPGLDFADQAQALQALGAAQVVAFSHFACQSTRSVADVILPIGALAEIDATLTNLEGRDQQATAAGKLPGDARSGWRVLRALGGALEAPGFEFTDLAGLRAGLQGRAVSVAASAAPVVDGDGFELAVSQAIYRVDGLTRRAAALQSHPLTLGPRIVLHPDDAAASQVADGGMAKVSNAVGTATLQVAIDDRVAPGAAWVESGYGATAALSVGKVKVVAA
ncbi:NADH-quinone oxidoreductase subunit NuoG [Luteimonas fraxinea]|uniref:NADH-quinone oxidoreductase subunit NuoG n=1 Tax=Luteimonas fraxinea TaxID=2901869 RepID=UPI001E5E0F1F|nr:NADH-quinone oxidoreductase subunit NuoG [Luteimonas fraxinea]MCD9126523.1 NADH-quinone oxidoreductase subunit NuoG [Luteimonas fraxinea]UHH09494.1 NADH-quinone oxidoreductase subunit NuoG [Luteimonas fraxinea]